MNLLGYYDFRVSLRNDGRKSVKEFMVEVEIPRKYMGGSGSRGTRTHAGQEALQTHPTRAFAGSPAHALPR